MLRFSLIWCFIIAYSVEASEKNAELSGHQVWTVRHKNSPEFEVRSVVTQLQFDGKIDVFAMNEMEATFSVHQRHKHEVELFLKDADLSYVVDVLDLREYLDKTETEETERKLKSKRKITKRSTSLCSPSSEEYMSFDEIESYLSCISNQFPSRVTKTSIGKTEENRDIWMMTVKSKEDHPSKSIFIIGGTHAREWISPSVALFLLHKYAVMDQKAASGFEIKIIPVLNPDGYVYSTTTNRMWRKNRSRNYKSRNCVGVDLNRNWGYEWGSDDGSSPNCKSETYRGTSAFSEKEMKAVSFQMKNTPNLTMVIDIHSYSQVVLYPWSFSKNETISMSDQNDIVSMANVFATAAYGVNNTEYRVVNAASGLYVASGVSMDYAYGTLGVKYSYVIELRDKGKFGFLLPTEQIEPTQNEVYEGIDAMLRKLRKY